MQRYANTNRLAEALRLLLEVYDEWGGASREVGRVLRMRIDESLAEPDASRGDLQQRLAGLMRARDFHQFVMEAPELVPLKLQFLETLLLYRSPEERWAGARALLLEQVDGLCGKGRAGTAGTLESVKLALSDSGSILGKLLMVVALMNLDQEGEGPGAHLRLRFLPGRFPAHAWVAAAAPVAGQRSTPAEAHWIPTHPLCRWNYLAADLAHAVYRRMHPRSPALPADASATAAPSPAEHGAQGPMALYCQLGTGRAAQEGQMELLPIETPEFLSRVQRHVHRKHGPESLRLFNLLLAHLHRLRPASACSFRYSDLLEGAGIAGLSESVLKDRVKRLERVIETLAEVELIRVIGTGSDAYTLHSRFLTVLERRGEGLPRAGGAAAGGASASLKGVSLAADPWFFPRRGETLGAAFQDLPPTLVAAPVKEHPFALSLYVHLRGHWQRGADEVRGTAEQLMADAGLWLGETACYRALESLRRDMAWLREQGLVGAWRVDAAGSRDGRQARYRIERPFPAGHAKLVAQARAATPARLTG